MRILQFFQSACLCYGIGAANPKWILTARFLTRFSISSWPTVLARQIPPTIAVMPIHQVRKTPDETSCVTASTQKTRASTTVGFQRHYQEAWLPGVQVSLPCGCLLFRKTNQSKDGSFNGSSAGYHGYWITDFTTVDPHMGTEEEFKVLSTKLIREAGRSSSTLLPIIQRILLVTMAAVPAHTVAVLSILTHAPTWKSSTKDLSMWS